MHKISIFEAKQRLRIPDLWRHFGFPGEPKNSCRCPWREDHKPSFSVSKDGMLWYDFATGEGGDAVDFLQRATGLSHRHAFQKFLELTSGSSATSAGSIIRKPKITEKPRPKFPSFRTGTEEDLQRLSKLRNIRIEGLRFANDRGVLRFEALYGIPAWIVTDRNRVSAQARRMDGQHWAHIGAKAWTLGGSWARYPIGIHEARTFPAIALCEGGPDFLAAHDLVLRVQTNCYQNQKVRCAPVAMLGAKLTIHPNALPLFAAKRVRIFAHSDCAGREAAERWTDQLRAIAADVDSFYFDGLLQADGRPVEDLNDVLNMDRNSFIAVGERLFPS